MNMKTHVLILILILSTIAPFVNYMPNENKKIVPAEKILKPLDPTMNKLIEKSPTVSYSTIEKLSDKSAWTAAPGFWWDTSWEYRVNVTITEPGISDRENWPVDIYMTFDPPAYKFSVRVIDSQGNEIPSQIWGVEYYNTSHISGCHITFLVNITMNGELEYSIYWSTSYKDPPTYPKRITYYESGGVYYISTKKGIELAFPASTYGRASSFSYAGTSLSHFSASLNSKVAHFGITEEPTFAYEDYWGEANTNNQNWEFIGILEEQDSLEQIYAGVIFVTYAIERVDFGVGATAYGKVTYEYRIFDWGILVYERYDSQKIYDTPTTIYLGGWIFDQDDGLYDSTFTVIYPPEQLLSPEDWDLFAYDDFNELDTNKWLVDRYPEGYAYPSVSDSSVILTDNTNDHYGIIWYYQTTTKDFIAEFRVYIGDDDSSFADGLVFMFYKSKSYNPAWGGSLGFEGSGTTTGWGVELDTWDNGASDPDAPHIAVIKDYVNNHKASYTLDRTLFFNNWHTIKVIVEGDNIKVYYDGTLVIDYTDSELLNREYGYFGFSAATGGANEWHKIDWVKIYVKSPGAESIDMRFYKQYQDNEAISLFNNNSGIGVGAVFLNLTVSGSVTSYSASIVVNNEGNQENDGFTTDQEDYIYWAVNISNLQTTGSASIELTYVVFPWDALPDKAASEAKFDNIVNEILNPLTYTFDQKEAFKIRLYVNVTDKEGTPISANVSIIKSGTILLWSLTNSSGFAEFSLNRTTYNISITILNGINLTLSKLISVDLSVYDYTVYQNVIDAVFNVYKVLLYAYDKRETNPIEGGILKIYNDTHKFEGVTDVNGEIVFWIEGGLWTLEFNYTNPADSFVLHNVTDGSNITVTNVTQVQISIYNDQELKLWDYDVITLYTAYLDLYETQAAYTKVWGDNLTLKVKLYNETTILEGQIKWIIVDEYNNEYFSTITTTSNGIASITINTMILPAGKTYAIIAKAIEVTSPPGDYIKPEKVISLTVENRPAYLNYDILPDVIYYGDTITLSAVYVDEVSGQLITGATLKLILYLPNGSKTIELNEDDDGVYSATITGLNAGTYSGILKASKMNYTEDEKDLIIRVNERPTVLHYPISIEIQWNESYTFEIEYVDYLTGDPIKGANMTVKILKSVEGPVLGSAEVIALEGSYLVKLNLSNIDEGKYVLEFSAGLKNYRNLTEYASLIIDQRIIDLDVSEKTIDTYWGDEVAITINLYDKVTGENIMADAPPTIRAVNLDSGTTAATEKEIPILDCNNGTYIIKFNTSILGIGRFKLHVLFYKKHYAPASVEILTFVNDREGLIYVMPIAVPKVTWGDILNFTITIVDKETLEGVDGVFIVSKLSLGGENITTDAIQIVPLGDGHYTVVIDTGKLDVGNYTLELSFVKNFYKFPSKVLAFQVRPVTVEANVDLQTNVEKNPITGDAKSEVTITLIEKDTGVAISNAQVFVLVVNEETGEIYENITAEFTGSPGVYKAVIDWSKASPGTYKVMIVVKKYERKNHIATQSSIVIAGDTEFVVNVNYIGGTIEIAGKKLPTLVIVPSLVILFIVLGIVGYRLYSFYILPPEVKELIRLINKIKKDIYEYGEYTREDVFKEELRKALKIQ